MLVAKVLYIKLDVAWQRLKLSGYRTGIVAAEETAPLASDRFALFVFYEPEGAVAASVQRAVTALRGQDVNVVILCNHPLSPAQRDWLGPRCHTLIVRDNQGFDFGAWKDGVAFLREKRLPVGRLVLMNDSVFFAERGLTAMITRMLGDEDIVAAFENWSPAEDHHIQSFALALSGAVVASPSFRAFWDGYVPVNNRIYAIERGEKLLSRAVLAAARTTHVMFSAAALNARLTQHPGPLFEPIVRLPNPWRAMVASNGHEIPRDRAATHVTEIINITSPIHAGAYWFPRLLDAPLFKKDLVYRNRFAFWEVESWLGELLPPDEAEEFLTVLQKKGDASQLSGLDRLKLRIGVK